MKGKRIILSTLLAVVMLFTMAPAVLAFDGPADAEVYIDVDVLDISIVDVHSGTNNPYLGAIVHASGTVTVSAEATAHNIPVLGRSYAETWVLAGYTLKNPDGDILDHEILMDEDEDRSRRWFGFMAHAENEIILSWSYEFTLDTIGVYIIKQYGVAEAFAESRLLWLRYSDEAEGDMLNLVEINCVGRPWWETHFMFIMRAGYTRLYEMGEYDGLLAEEIDSAGRFSPIMGDYSTTSFHDLDQYMIVVPEGTTILRVDGVRPKCLWVNEIDPVTGEPHATTFMTVLFSQPYTVYKMEGFLIRPSNTFTREWWEGDGEWVPVYTSTVLEGGVSLP